MHQVEVYSVSQAVEHLQNFLKVAMMSAVLSKHGMQAQGEKKVVGSMGPGGFFGELALIRQNSTRAADCIALQTTKVCPRAPDSLSLTHTYSIPSVLKLQIRRHCKLGHAHAREPSCAKQGACTPELLQLFGQTLCKAISVWLLLKAADDRRCWH